MRQLLVVCSGEYMSTSHIITIDPNVKHDLKDENTQIGSHQYTSKAVYSFHVSSIAQNHSSFVKGIQAI